MIRDTLGVPVCEGDTVVLAGVSDSELRVGLVIGVYEELEKVKLVTTKNRLAFIVGDRVVKVPYFNVNKDTRDTLHKIARSIYQ